jgi:hypothetical protein
MVCCLVVISLENFSLVIILNNCGFIDLPPKGDVDCEVLFALLLIIWMEFIGVNSCGKGVITILDRS